MLSLFQKTKKHNRKKIEKKIFNGGKTMDGSVKGMLFILLLIYIISPIDFCPGPIDDMILIMISLAANRRSIE